MASDSILNVCLPADAAPSIRLRRTVCRCTPGLHGELQVGVIQRASRAGVVLVVALSCWGCGAGTWKAPPINGEFLVPEPIPGEEKDTTDEFFGDDDDDAAPEASGEDGAAAAGDAKAGDKHNQRGQRTAGSSDRAGQRDHARRPVFRQTTL